MADSQVEAQQTQPPAAEEQSSGLFSSSFSKLGNALPSFSVPWGNSAKTDDEQQQQQQEEQQPSDASAVDANADAAAAEGGFLSKLTGGLPSVNIGLPSMPWSKKDGDQAASDGQQDAEPQANANGTGQSMLAGVSGGFSKLTGGLPSVNVPSFGLPSMPWSKKDGEAATEAEPAADAAQDANEKSDSLAGESLNAMKAGADKLSSAMTGIFGVFKSSEDSAPKAEEDAASK